PTVVELKSASVARVVPTGSCVVVDLCSVPVELTLVDGHLPQVWHTFAAPEPLGDDAADVLAQPLRALLRFYRRRSDGEFGRMVPVFVSAEQSLAPHVLSELSTLVDQPVHALPAPPRVPGDMRLATYLACVGLLMRRSGG
ncbi:MAG TPA: hypothetical protein VKE27_11835, partial [Candidatus Dormibacteraeota bacterium]|nr:hypothetical protein [Candidatus Dormibacteraeota bacterium]